MERKLILKKLLDVLTKEKEAIFNQWYERSPKNKAYFEEEKKWYAETPHGKPKLNETAAWENVDGRLSVDTPKTEKHGVRKHYWKYAVAASVVLLISFGAFFYDHFFSGDVTENTIEIGSSKAILTLEDGTEVALKEGETYASDNINSDGESLVYGTGKEGTEAYNELTVPRGGEYLLKLADGTKVWLNSDSKIRYPNTFPEGKPRIVELLYGEAFFEVSPAAEHGGRAFKVTTRNQEIEVLGTQFNVSAYREDQVVTSTLVEGKVAVSNGNVKKELKPGEQAVVTANDMVVNEVDVYNYMAWKEGVFSFEDKSLEEVMEVLSRWFDIEVKFKNKDLENRRLGGLLNRKQDIRNILDAISGINEDLHFEIKGKEVIIK